MRKKRDRGPFVPRHVCPRCRRLKFTLCQGQVCHACVKQQYRYCCDATRAPKAEREARIQFYGKRADLKLPLFTAQRLLALFIGT